MKMKSILLVFSYLTLGASHLYANCEKKTTKIPPFYVSSSTGQGHRIYENLRSLDNIKKIDAYLPKESLVRSLIPEGEQMEGKNHPIEVIHSAHYKRETYLKRSRSFFKNLLDVRKKLARAKRGDKGYLHSNSLRTASSYSFVFADTHSSGDFRVLTPRMDKAKNYLIECETGAYFFDVIIKKSGSNEKGAPIVLNMDDSQSIDFIASLVAIPNDMAKTIIQIFHYVHLDKGFEGYAPGDLEYLHSLKLIKVPFDDETLELPYNAVYYNPDNRGRDDIFANPLAACALLSTLKKYDDEFGDDKNSVAVGDFFHLDKWGDHSTHDSKNCVDIRPVRNDGRKAALSYKDRRIYDQRKTLGLVRLLKSSGGSPIYFNDPYIINRVKTVSARDGHHNHIHVCFKNVKKVQKTCYEH